MTHRDPKTSNRARDLRKSLTDTERLLWSKLRRKQIDGCKFRRQQVLGPYIGDFVCIEKKLIVELDGGQHLEQEEYDAQRTRWLESRGFRVLRFWNNQVLEELEGVLQVIQKAIE